MKDMLQSQADRYTKEHKKKKRWQKVVTALAAVAVFCTTYALILPAITWERSLVCEIPEHQHEDSCYEIVTVPSEKELVCPETEHVHGPGCYIVTDNLICGLEECAGHTHGEGCFDEAGELICNIEESEGHSHSETCYEKELVCQIPEHTHSDSCWVESEPHEEKVLVCQLKEHEHTAACFDAPPAEDDGYYCGQIEHFHSEDQYCYFSDGSLRCTIPEHEHTLSCKSNPKADVETAAVWEKTFENVELSGKWSEDVLAIAKTQIGYRESALNYNVEDDEIKGYTRYGAWYGSPYGDWCAMFCSFCLNYAKVDRELMPIEASCPQWVADLKEDEIFFKPDAYDPKPGDLIFFDWDEINPETQRKADHVGFVSELVYDKETNELKEIKTIEGNSGETVKINRYDPHDVHIMGYGKLPENPNAPRIMKAAKAAAAVISIPECTCSVGSANLISHADQCELKSFAKSIADDLSAEQIYAIWNQLPDNMQAFVIEYLGWSYANHLKREELNRLIEEGGGTHGDVDPHDPDPEDETDIPLCDCVYPPEGLANHSDTCPRKAYVRTLCSEKTAEEIYTVWLDLPEDIQTAILTILGNEQQMKLEQLQEYLAEIIGPEPVEKIVSAEGLDFTLFGAFPETAIPSVSAVGAAKLDMLKTRLADSADHVLSGAYDISVMDGENRFEPESPVEVCISGLDFGVEDVSSLRATVYHFVGLDAEDLEAEDLVLQPKIEKLDAWIAEDGSLCFVTNSFSVFYYTVDFQYGDITFSIEGETTIRLSDLFVQLGLHYDVSDVESVVFSNPDLLQVTSIGGDWMLTSLQAFKSEEKLTVTFTDGLVIEIKVIDAMMVKLEVTDNYNLITTVTDIELLLDKFNVRSTLGLSENTRVNSVSVSPASTTSGNEFRVMTNSAGHQSIRCTKNFTEARKCTVVFDAQDENGYDIACEFTNITADNDSRYTLWNYANGEGGAGSPRIVQGNFVDVVGNRNGTKDWCYPTSATNNSNIHTENAPIGYSNAVFTNKNGTNVNPITIDGQKYHLYVSSNDLSTAYNGSNYRSGSTTTGIQLGRYTNQPCSLPCINGTKHIVAWIEDVNGNKVVMPDVCIGNEGASNLWFWQFGGSGQQVIYTNDGIKQGRRGTSSTGQLAPSEGLKWNNTYGTAVSLQYIFQGIQPDANGYYTLYLTNRSSTSGATGNVDELSVFKFVALSDVKKVVLDVNGNEVTGATQNFDFGVHYQPQVLESDAMTQDGKITDYFQLSNGEKENINGVVGSTFTVWEEPDPYYTTTVRQRVGNSTTTTTIATTTETVTEDGKTYERIRPTNDQAITAGTDKVTIEFVNRKKPTVFISKTFTGLTLEQIAALRDNATDPFTITAVGQIGTLKLGLARSATDDFIDPYAISTDGMTYTWELPIPGNYTISESGFTIDGIECSTVVKNGSNPVSPNADGSYTIEITGSTANAVTIENIYRPSTVPLTVTKTVRGSSDSTAPFTVRIKETGVDLQRYTAKIESSSVTDVTFKESVPDAGVFDTVEFKITNGGSFTIPVVLGYEIEIRELSHEGYTVKIDVTDTDGEGQFSDNANDDRYVIESMPAFAVTAAITNTRSNLLPETGGIGAYPFYILGATLVGGALIYGYILRRKREGRAE